MAREHAGHTLQTTALVHEAYLRLVDIKQVNWQDRAHFMAMCARLMRRVLVDFARFQEVQPLAPASDPDLIALDSARSTSARGEWWSCASSAVSAWKKVRKC
jgi:hypothetical protein